MNKLGRIIIIIILCCSTGLLGLLLALRSEQVQIYLINFAEKFLTENIGYKIKIEGFKISFPLKINVNSLTISDLKGEWLKAEGVKIKLFPLSLLPTRQILISDLSIIKLSVLSQPNPPKTNVDNKSNSAKGLILQRINFPHLIIKKGVISLNKELELSIKGELKYITNKLEFGVRSDLLNNFNQYFTDAKMTFNGYFDTEHKFLNIQEIDISTALFAIQGFSSIDFEKNLINGKYDISCSQLSRIIPELKGTLKSVIYITNTLHKPLLNGKIELCDLEYASNKFLNLSFITKLDYDLEQQIGELKIEEERTEFFLSTYFKDKADMIKFEQIQAVRIKDNITGELNYIKNYNVLNGHLELESRNFKTLGDLLNISLSAEGHLFLKLMSDKEIQKASIAGDVNNLIIKNFLASNLQIKAKISDAWNLTLEEADIKIQDVRYKDDTILKTIDFKANSFSNITELALKIEGKPYKNFELVTSGSIELDSKDKFDLNITKINGIYNKSKISSSGITIKYKDRKLQYDISEINFGKGKIIAHGSTDNHNINSKIIFKTLPLTLINPNLPMEFARAALDSEIEMKGKVSYPEIVAMLNISNINFVPQEASNLILDAKYKENNFQLTSVIKNSNLMRGDFKLMLPLHFSLLPYEFEIEMDKGMTGNLNTDLRIDSLAALLLPPIQLFKGKLIADVKISGNLNNPKIVGRCDIKEATYEHILAGIKVKNINSIIETDGERIKFKEFKAYDNDKKSISATGQWILNKKNMPFNLAITSNGLYFLNHPNIQGSAKADIKISGDINKAKIEGTIEPTLLEITIPEQFKKEIIELNVTKIVLAHSSKEQLNSKGFLSCYNIVLDILIKAKHKVFVRGCGVDAELGGELQCKGKLDAPEIKGKLETIRGRYQEFGKQLTIQEGSLIFNGPIPPSPYLNIMGRAIQDNIEVRLILAGPLLKPGLSIESNPPLANDEALSILLFGKQSAQISHFQGLQLADSLRRLSGHGGSTNMLGHARSLLKVDDIKIKNNSNDVRDAALGVGKYLTDRVYLEIEKGMQVGSGKTRIELEIKNNLSVESSVGESGSNTIGINWRRDY